MRKLNVLLFCSLCLGLTISSMLSNNYYLDLVVSSGDGSLFIRLVVSAALMAYTFMPQIRNQSTKAIMRTAGISLFLCGIATLIAPGLFGYSVSYVPIGDLFILLEGGILAMLLSIQLPIQSTSMISSMVGNNTRYLATILATQPRKLTKGVTRPRATQY